jgi:hypothetical protein
MKCSKLFVEMENLSHMHVSELSGILKNGCEDLDND